MFAVSECVSWRAAVRSSSTCVIGRVAVGIQELFDEQGAGEQGVLGNGVQVGLQASLPLCYEVPVHVPNQLLGRKEEADSTHLHRRRSGQTG